MSLIKNIIVLSSFILSMSIISHAYAADICIPKSQGEIKEITIAEDGYHFFVSFGNYTETMVWRNQTEPTGRAAFALLRIALSNSANIEVVSCNSSSILDFKVNVNN